MSLDDVVVLNVDTNTLETPYEDLQSLPNDVVKTYICSAWFETVQYSLIRSVEHLHTLMELMQYILWCGINVLITGFFSGFLFKRSFEKGFNNNRGRCCSSLPQESGCSVWQLQKCSPDWASEWKWHIRHEILCSVCAVCLTLVSPGGAYNF